MLTGFIQLADVDPMLGLGVVLAIAGASTVLGLWAAGKASDRHAEQEREAIRQYHRRGLP